MDIKFECPKCGLAMQSSTDKCGFTAHCPVCAQEFGVETNQPVIPVVQARVVASHAPVQLPNASPPSVQGPPPQRARTRPLQHPHASPRAKPAPVPDKRDFKERMGFIGLALVFGLLVFLAIWVTRLGDQPQGPTPEQIAVKDEEKEKIAEEIDKQTQLMRGIEEAKRERERKLAEQAAIDRKNAEEEYERITREREEMLQHYAKLFGGDTVAAEAFVRVINISSMEVVDSIRARGTHVTEESFYRDLLRSLEINIERDSVLSQWMKDHNHDPRQFIPKLLGTRKISRPTTTFDFAKYKGSGSGFCVSQDGWFLTNQHVVTDAKTVDIRLRNGQVIPAKVFKTDADNDLAILKADLKATSWLGVSESKTNLGLGRPVFTVGYPNPVAQGVQPKFTEGSISAEFGFGDEQKTYQVSVPLQSGNSGGALVDSHTGWVIGVVCSRLGKTDAQLVNYAIKGKVVRSFVDSIPEAKLAAASAMPGLTPGDKQAAITRATESSVLILLPH